ncbi:MAG: FHA domain-containing protein [Burkholderiaceae bacterium]
MEALSDEALPAIEQAPLAPLGLLEVLDRDGQVRATCLVEAWPLRVGRALDNDVVLADPHVAAHLLRIAADAGGVRFVVGATVNGMVIGGQRVVGGEHRRIAAGSAPIELTAGRTRLRLRLADHPLAPELPLSAATTGAPRTVISLVLALVLAAGLLFSAWLDSDPDGLGRALATTLLSGILGAAVWCGLWALLSKTFTRQGHFGWHLRVFLIASIAWLALGVVPALLAFAFDWPWITDFAFVATLAVAGTAFYYHLLAVEPARPRGVRWAAVTATLVGIGLTLWFNLQRTDRLGEELYMSHLFPPALRLAQPVPVDTFVNGMAPLQALIDRKAKEPARGEMGLPGLGGPNRGEDDE